MIWKQRIAASALGLILALLAVEVLLQIASYVAWSSARSAGRPVGPLVLCVGDSLTYGLGSTSKENAYPARLEVALRDRGRPRSVVSGAWPGQSSADVLRRLPDQLAALRPDVVCVLVGWNDTWARPLPIETAASGGSGFPLRWRTGRLFALLGADVDRHVDPPVETTAVVAPPFLGAWHVGAHEFFFSPEGWALVGGVTMPWTIDGERILMTRPDGEVVPLRWQMAGAELKFAIEGWHRFETARRGRAADRSGIETAADLLRDGRRPEAIAVLEAELDGPRAAQARAELIAICVADDQPAAAEEHFAALRNLYAGGASVEAGELLALSLRRTGALAEADEVAGNVLRVDPDRVACWRLRIDATDDPPTRNAIAADLGAAIAETTSPWTRALLLVERAVAVAATDIGVALEDLAHALALGAGQDETIAAFERIAATGARGDELAAQIDRLDAAPEVKAALRGHLRRATAADDEVFAVLDEHLAKIVAACRSAGADVVLLGYPFPMPQHEAVVARAAARLDVPFVTMADRFALELETSERPDWFVDEIHCTDRGYALMAELVATVLK